jgi:serine/threonine protein kinase
MAPETARGGLINERTDIYNLGATMYRLATWRLPPSRLSGAGGLPPEAKTWQKLLKPVQEFNAEAPKELCELIHKCLAFNSHNRPERVSEVQGASITWPRSSSASRKTAWKCWNGEGTSAACGLAARLREAASGDQDWGGADG